MNRNEVYIGSEVEIERIERFLELERQTIPKRFKKKHIALEKAIEQDALGIDWQLFDTVVSKAENHFKKIDKKFSLMPRDRYLIAPCNKDSIGGFYGRPVGGYYYYNDLGFGTILNEKTAPNKTLRTMEVIRSYLHDSIHASTYRTFRATSGIGYIYRHQYGINFRNADRTSYSSPNANKDSPHSINLNTWMDGLVQKHISAFIKQEYNDILQDETLTPLEREIWSEVKDLSFDPQLYHQPCEFYKKILEPVDKFMGQWGEDFLMDEVLKSMFTGKLDNLKNYFSEILMKPNAWSEIFRQPAYKDIVKPTFSACMKKNRKPSVVMADGG